MPLVLGQLTTRGYSIVQIYFDNNNIGDQFMNVSNDIITAVFVFNNNVTCEDKVCIYVAIY